MTNYHPFVKAVARGLRTRCGVRAGDHLLVAVSGGADSTALLRALALLAPRRKWHLKLTVGHVHHHLRDGDDGSDTGDADRDAAFVKSLADDLKIPFVRGDIDPAQYDSGNTEAIASAFRYRLLYEAAMQCGAGRIVSAHHADDQLETLLMRFVRGTGVSGLRGIEWVRSGPRAEGLGPGEQSDRRAVLRPMLATTRDDVLSFLESIEQPWREDHTNADRTRMRALVRHEVLPVLRTLNAEVAQSATRMADHMNEVSDVLKFIVDQARAAHVRTAETTRTTGAITIDRQAIAALPTAARFELLRALLIDQGHPADQLSRQTLQPIVRAIADKQGGKRTFALAEANHIRLTGDSIIIES